MPDGDAPEVRDSGVTSALDQVLTVTEMWDLERNNMIRALDRANWKISGTGGAAEQLGLNANTLASRMKALGIKRG
jgi:transcriptional regulator with GAF, ATPase, and Fis domain